MLKKFDFEKEPVVEIVNNILVDSSKRGASDIHFDPHEEFMLIRIRIDGALIDYAEVPNGIKKNLITRIKIISGMNITESRLPQDGAIKQTIQDVDLDLRVSCLPTLDGEKVVIRILDYTMSQAGLETLGFSKSNYEKILKMISTPIGIILITGATGSGKSTTVYSILQRLNKEDTNIITVEDPIEMNIEGINQVQTNSEIGLTFANALRSILRQDPNIIMIGEIRDTETAKIAVRASITGHLVLSTIHTNNSLNTIERLLDMDVERYLLASALTGIVSQKLARKLCPKCSTKRPTNEYEKELFKKVLHRDIDEVYTAEGCDECSSGYKGRIAIHEVLLVNQAIKDAISSNLRKDKLRELVYKNDVTTLLQDGLEKVIEGKTTVEEILKIIELDNDDNSSAGNYDLKDALNLTEISQAYQGSNPQVINMVPPMMYNTMNQIQPQMVQQDMKISEPMDESLLEFYNDDSTSEIKQPTIEPVMEINDNIENISSTNDIEKTPTNNEQIREQIPTSNETETIYYNTSNEESNTKNDFSDLDDLLKDLEADLNN